MPPACAGRPERRVPPRYVADRRELTQVPPVARQSLQLGGQRVAPVAGLAQMSLGVRQTSVLHRGVIAPVIGGAQTFERARVMAVGKRAVELSLFRHQGRDFAFQSLAVFGSLALFLLEFAAPVPV